MGLFSFKKNKQLNTESVADSARTNVSSVAKDKQQTSYPVRQEPYRGDSYEIRCPAEETTAILQIDVGNGKNGTAKIGLMEHVGYDGVTGKDIFKKRQFFTLPFYKLMIQRESEYCIRYYFNFDGDEAEQRDARKKFLAEFMPAYESARKNDMGHSYLRMQIRADRYPYDYVDSGEILLDFEDISIDGNEVLGYPPQEPDHVFIFTGIRPDNIKNVYDENGTLTAEQRMVTQRGAAEVKNIYSYMRLTEEQKSLIKMRYGNIDIRKHVENGEFDRLFNSAFYEKASWFYGHEKPDFDKPRTAKDLDDAIAELPESDRKIINKDLINVLFGKRISMSEMIGLESVKRELDRMQCRIAYNKIQVERGVFSSKDVTMHMCFTGNPGTGKTTVARYITGCLHSLGYIKYNECIEVNAQHLKGAYSGQTTTIVKTILKAAKGKVLFIDEAYALYDSYDNGYGQEAISVLIKEMEDNRNDLVIIFAGYKKEMEKFLAINEGLKSRINRYIDFPDYTPMELTQIFGKFLGKLSINITDEALFESYKLFAKAAALPNFSNARFVRNYVEKIQAEHAFNYYQKIVPKYQGKERNYFKFTITEDDITKKIKDELLSMSK